MGGTGLKGPFQGSTWPHAFSGWGLQVLLRPLQGVYRALPCRANANTGTSCAESRHLPTHAFDCHDAEIFRRCAAMRHAMPTWPQFSFAWPQCLPAYLAIQAFAEPIAWPTTRSTAQSIAWTITCPIVWPFARPPPGLLLGLPSGFV